jgi:putative DNA primase/helicase
MQGVSEPDAQRNLEGVFDAVAPTAQDSKWRKTRSRIPVYLARAYERAAKALAKARSSGGGRPLVIASPTPWPQPVDGEELLTEVAGVLKTYVVLQEAALHAVSLWIIHTYVFSTTMITPRLLLKSAEKRSGKTTLLLVIERMASRAIATANISPAALFRTIDLAAPTLLVDEADTFLSENEELRGVINAGFMRGGQTIRVVGDDHLPRAFNCFAPVAIATIRRLPDTIEDRAIAIAMRRKTKNEAATRLRLDRLTQLAPLASKIQRWANDNSAALETVDPAVPAALNDRAADCWRVLLAIADIIGGAWPECARSAATSLSADNEDVETTGTMLLADLRDLFVARQQDELFSWEIAEALGKMETRPWPEWGRRRAPITVVQLARLLAHFKIRPGDVHRGTLHAKGYSAKQCQDAFERYLA